jgi:uncharacterized membrane protein YbhN (UPF0104 family)
MASENLPDNAELAKPIPDTPGAPGGMSPRVQLAITVSVVIGIALYLGAVLLADATQIRHQAASISAGVWGILIAASLLNYALRFVRWDWFTRHNGGHIPWLRHAIIYVIGFSLTTTPGKAGEAIRSLYMTRYGVAMHHSFASLFVERLIDLISIAALATLAVGLLADAPLVLGLSGALVVVAALSLSTSLPESIARRGANFFRSGAIGAGFSHVAALFASSRNLLNLRMFAAANVIGLIAWSAEGLGFYVLLSELGTDVSIFVAMGIYGAAVLIGALSFLPGGLGSTEAAMIAMLMAAGTDLSTAVLATIVCRIVTLWFAVALGLVAMAFAVKSERSPVEAHS